MTGTWLAPPLLTAFVVMVLFALIPRRFRYLQLSAVLGWAAVWSDTRLTAAWLDFAGSALVLSALAVLTAVLRRERDERTTTGDA
jgi:hypothetical protein